MLCSSNGILSGSTQCQFVPILGMFIRECLSDFSAIKLTDKYLVLINKQLTCSLCGDNSENMQISVPHRAFIHWFYFYLFIYLWLRWVFVAAHRLSLVAASRGYSSLQCMGFSLWWLFLLWSTGSRSMGFSSCGTWVSSCGSRASQSAGSVVVVHGLSCSVACGIFPDQGSKPCPLHWQADS